MSAPSSSTADKPAGTLQDLVAFWQSLPDKPLFFSLAALWVVFFQLLGNSTFGYTDTPSLFGWLNYAYNNSSDDAHGRLVPFVVLALVWFKRQELIATPKASWWPALSLVVMGLLLHAASYVTQQTRVSVIAFFTGLYGLTGLVWGRHWLKASFFPYFLFIFCFPLGTLADKVTFPLRILATKITVGIAHTLLGNDGIQNGTSIWEPTGRFQYEVAAACSGLRSLTAVFALATIYGFVDFRKTWPRLILVAAAFPLALAGNVVRLSTIIIAAETFGQRAGNYVHDSAWFSLLPYLPPFLGLVILGHWLGSRGAQSLPGW